MKGLVVYDSFYGNTRLIAEAMAAEMVLGGHQAEVASARAGLPTNLDYDFLLIGSPTRMGRMTRSTKKFVKELAASSWGKKPVATFDTVMPGVEEKGGSSAGQRLQDLAKDAGLKTHPKVLHTQVTGMRGPLAPDAIEKAKSFTQNFLSSISQ